MNHCLYCGKTIPGTAQHCPYCGTPLPKKSLSPRLFYLAGFTLLIISGLWLGNYLKLQPFAFLQSLINIPVATIEAPAEDLPTVENDPTRVTPTSTTIPPTNVPPTNEQPTPIVPSESPIGKIVFTCQISKNENRNQICIANADGSGERRLTTNALANHYYASFSPDGKSIVFSSNQAGSHDIYEMDLNGRQTQLTSIGESYGPEISPDGNYIVFANSGGAFSSIWMMDRDGKNPHEVFVRGGIGAFDPTWSPDGKKILFALGVGDNKKLHTIDPDGSNLQIISEEFTTRGRSDWSPDGNKIAGYTGGSWQRKIYLMNSDGSGLLELFSTGNVQAPTFSPDGGWVAFTGYIDSMRNGNGCEIYLLRVKDNELKRLTTNDYCDWQPRWGP
jgi:TolB protein